MDQADLAIMQAPISEMMSGFDLANKVKLETDVKVSQSVRSQEMAQAGNVSDAVLVWLQSCNTESAKIDRCLHLLHNLISEKMIVTESHDGSGSETTISKMETVASQGQISLFG